MKIFLKLKSLMKLCKMLKNMCNESVYVCKDITINGIHLFVYRGKKRLILAMVERRV